MTGETAHDGASGDDTLTGGAGADHFVFDPNHGNDVVTDFTDGEDLIDLSAFSTISGFSDLTMTSDENGVTIDLTAHGGGTIVLQGFALNDLDASARPASRLGVLRAASSTPRQCRPCAPAPPPCGLFRSVVALCEWRLWGCPIRC